MLVPACVSVSDRPLACQRPVRVLKIRLRDFQYPARNLKGEFMKRLTVLGMICILAASSVLAEEGATVFDRFPSALGAHGVVDFAGGNGLGGLSYQHWFGRNGLQVAAGGLVSEYGSYNYNLFGSYQYRLFGDDFNSWFAGALYTNVLLGHSGSGGSSQDFEPLAHLGLGIGIESVLLEHLAPSIEFMYLGSLNPLDLALSIGFGMGFSLRYRY